MATKMRHQNSQMFSSCIKCTTLKRYRQFFVISVTEHKSELVQSSQRTGILIQYSNSNQMLYQRYIVKKTCALGSFNRCRLSTTETNMYTRRQRNHTSQALLDATAPTKFSQYIVGLPYEFLHPQEYLHMRQIS